MTVDSGGRLKTGRNVCNFTRIVAVNTEGFGGTSIDAFGSENLKDTQDFTPKTWPNVDASLYTFLETSIRESSRNY